MLKDGGLRPITRGGSKRSMFMNRVLRVSPAIPEHVILRIKARRVTGLSLGKAVRLTTRSGNTYDFELVDTAAPLADKVPVYVWWSVGGLVCAPVSQVDTEDSRARSIARKVAEARQALERAREQRSQTPPAPPEIDIVL